MEANPYLEKYLSQRKVFALSFVGNVMPHSQTQRFKSKVKYFANTKQRVKKPSGHESGFCAERELFQGQFMF